MAGWDFPTSLEVGGVEREIRSDYRVILDLMEVLTDETIDNLERANVALSLFYYGVDYGGMPDHCRQEAIDKMLWFIRCGEDEEEKNEPRLMDWNQDFHLVAAPINRILGYECRAVPYNRDTNEGGLHWWTFISAYMEIGECYFQQVVDIRRKKRDGKLKHKGSDWEFYKKHRKDIDLRRKLTEEEASLLAKWTS